MGLAASQARLLCITMRITDDQYQLMKLSSQQLSLSAKTTDIDEQYDYMKNAVNYSYNGNENFTYSDLMGASGLTAGLESPVFVTNKDNKIVLDGAYGMAMQSAYMASNGKPKGSSTGFNAFVAQITGDSTTDWYKASQGKLTSTSVSSGTDSTGSTNNNTSTRTITKTQLTAEAQALRDKYDAAREYVAKNYGSQPAKPGLKKNNNNLAYDLLTEFDNGRTNGNNTFQKRLTIEDDIDDGLYQNEKGYNYASWTVAVNKYCQQQGLTTSYVLNGGYPPEANKTETITETVSTPSTTTPSENNSGSTGASGSINEDGTVNDEKTIKAAKYYLQIYNQACNGYVVDEQITNRDYMNAQLENNNLKIGGKLASENEDIKKGLAKDNEDKLEQIKSWYNKETNSIKNEEKKIGLKQTSLQAEISALTTEQSSVQSLIDKNIERSFTYCQNG